MVYNLAVATRQKGEAAGRNRRRGRWNPRKAISPWQKAAADNVSPLSRIQISAVSLREEPGDWNTEGGTKWTRIRKALPKSAVFGIPGIRAQTMVWNYREQRLLLSAWPRPAHFCS